MRLLCRGTHSVETPVLIACILRKSPIGQHVAVDLSVQQIVLGELDKELCLSEWVDRSGSREQFLISSAHLHHVLLRSAATARHHLLAIIRHKVGLWDLIDGLKEVYGVRLHVYRAAVHVAIVRGHLKAICRTSYFLGCTELFALDFWLVRLLISWRSRLVNENWLRPWFKLTITWLA